MDTLNTRIGSGGRNFEFVMQDPNEKFSSETRAVIRRQAIRAVNAARERLGRSSGSVLSSRRLTARESGLGNPLLQMPYSGLELLVSHHGLDPMDLSALTSIHIGAVSVITILVLFDKLN